MTDFQDINNLNPTPTALITGADKVPFYNTSDAKAYAMTMDQLQTWVLAGGTIDPTFDDVSADTVTITGTTGNTLVVDTNTLVVDATNNAVLVGKTAASVGVDGAQFLTTGFSGVSAPNNTAFFLNRNGSDGTIVELARESTSRVTFGVTSQSLTIGTGGSERMRIDASGNVGIGVTPSAWVAAGNIQMLRGAVASLGAGPNDHIAVTANAYATGSADPAFATWLYNNAGQAAMYVAGQGGMHRWLTAPTGSAGGTITFTERMRLDSSGNLGLGVTPSATDTNGAFFIGGGREIIWASQTGYLSANARFFGGSDLYIANGSATRYLQTVGQHRWFTAPSGTAGNAITFTQAMTLDASGRLGLGANATSPTLRVQIETDANAEEIAWIRNINTGSSSAATLASSSAVGSVLLRAHSAAHAVWPNTTLLQSASGFTGGLAIVQAGANPISLHTNGTERARVKANGQVRFIPLAADPSGAEAGDVYYNSGTNKLKVYNGTAWVDLH